MDGHVHGQAISEAVGNSPSPEGCLQEAAWNAVERKRELETEAVIKGADGRTSELPALTAKIFIETQLAQFEDCVSYVRDTNLLGLYHEMILLEAISKIYCLHQIVLDHMPNDIALVDEPMNVCAALAVKQMGWRSAMAIIAGCAVVDFVWTDLEEQGKL